VHNGQRFLGQTLDSVLAQSLPDFELIVVDDGSSDETPAILASYAAREPRIRLHRQSKAGQVAARNKGYELAMAHFVANLDADDVALPTRLERQYSFMVEQPEVGVVGSAVAFIDERGRQFGSWNYPLADSELRRELAHTAPLAHPATMTRKDAVIECGGYRSIFIHAQDLDLWLRLSERHRLANLPDVLTGYRVHAEQATARRCED